MELPELVLKPIRAFKEMFDLEEEPPTLTSQVVQLRRQLAKTRSRLDEIRNLAREKDELIAKLQAAGAIKGNLIVDGSAYFVKKGGNILDGPFCTCCFDQNQEKVRIVPADKPQGAAGRQSEWVQCPTCRTPFRSKRVGEFLSAPATASRGAGSSARQSKKPVRKAPAKRKTTRVVAAAPVAVKPGGSAQRKKPVGKAPAKRKTTRVAAAAPVAVKPGGSAQQRKKPVRKAPAKRKTTRVARAKKTSGR